MTVSVRGNKFQAYVAKGPVRIRKQFDDRGDAIAWEATARNALAKGLPVPEPAGRAKAVVGRWTLVEASNRAYKLFWEGSKGEASTYTNMKKLREFFGDVDVNQITTDRVDDYILHLRRTGLSGASINRALACLSKILRTAHESEKLAKLPRIRKQKVDEVPDRWLEDHEVLSLLVEALRFPDLHDAITVSLDTGVRRGELLRVAKGDLQNGNLIIWESKAGKSRAIPLTKRAMEVLQRRGEGLDRKTPLFPAGTWLRTQWEDVRKAVGMDRPDVVWHSLRHTFASRLVQKGVPLQTVKDLMGHATLEMTMRYAKLSKANFKEAIEALEW